MPNYPSHILELAKRGAEHCYQELRAELGLLVRQFPHLRGGSASRLGSPAKTVKYPVRRRRRMSAAARKGGQQADEEILGSKTEREREGVGSPASLTRATERRSDKRSSVGSDPGASFPGSDGSEPL
jgi:hypothetical protein